VRIDLSGIEHEPVHFHEDLEVPVARLDSAQVATPFAVHLEGMVRSSTTGYRVEGDMTGSGELFCGRCLARVPWQVGEELAIELLPHPEVSEGDEIDLGDDELEVRFLIGDILDLADLAAEQVLLTMPMRVLCDPECAGLCPRCGGNLNVEGECRCEPDVDPRWETLKTLADQGNRSG
jgi:uncharacterized protein